MKKTLCKTIHEFDNGKFIPLEDIRDVYPIMNNKVTIETECDSFTFRFDSGEKAQSMRNGIIKELEEYYGLDSKR